MRAGVSTHIRNNVVGYVALFFALGLGTAWALENNSVKSRHIVDGQVKGQDTKASQVQARVGGSCAPGLSIRAISASGAVTCETVGGGGAPTGPAGGDLAGSAYPNPIIAPGAVNSGKVGNNSLIGDDINESTLGQVPSAVLGGFGRHTNTQGNCDPESETFVVCAFRTMTLPAPSRVLVIARIEAFREDDASLGRGTCRIGTSGAGPLTDTAVNLGVEGEDLTLMGVTPVLSAGTQSFGIDCNQTSPGAIRYWQAQVAAVALSAN